MLVVDIDGANKALGVVELTPDEKTLQCFAVGEFLIHLVSHSIDRSCQNHRHSKSFFPTNH